MEVNDFGKNINESGIQFKQVDIEITNDSILPVTPIPIVEKTPKGMKLIMNFHTKVDEKQARFISDLIARAIAEGGGVENAKLDKCFKQIENFTKSIPRQKRVIQLLFDLPENEILPKIGVNSKEGYCFIRQSRYMVIKGEYLDTIIDMLETYINSRDILPEEKDLRNFQNWLQRRFVQLIDSEDVLLKGGYQYYNKFQMMDLVAKHLPKSPTPSTGFDSIVGL